MINVITLYLPLCHSDPFSLRRRPLDKLYYTLNKIHQVVTPVLKVAAVTALQLYYLYQAGEIASFGLVCGIFVPYLDPIFDRIIELWQKSYKIEVLGFTAFSGIYFTTMLPLTVFTYSASIGRYIASRILRRPLPAQ
jgi:hypothetical protein